MDTSRVSRRSLLKAFVIAIAALMMAASLALFGCAQQSSNQSQQGSASKPSNTISVTVTITSTVSGHEIDKNTKVDIPEGATALDALTATGEDITVDNGFVKEIDGLANGSQGSMSGWLYTVNQESPTVGADQFTVNADDTVAFEFSTGM